MVSMPTLDTVESSATSMGDRSILASSSFKGSENVSIDSISDENLILEDWESYWNDLNARLTVSRMVSDSVIKGIVNAVLQEAAESNSLKEAEIAKLTKRLHLCEPDTVTGSKSVLPQVLAGTISQAQFTHSDPRKDDTRHLCSLNIAAERHLQLLKSGIDCIKSSNYCKVTNLGSENFGHCCVHDQLMASENLTQIDKSIDALGVILAAICQHTGRTTCLLNDSLCEQQWEWEFQKEVDTIIFQSFIKEQREEFDMKLCEQKSLFDIQNNFWLKKVSELSYLHEELDSISKSIVSIEAEHSHIENGFVSTEKHEQTIPEVADSSLLLHMSKEDLIGYFQNEMNKIKRQLESSLHEKTEELFRLKREIFKERGSLHCRRDKDLEALKKKFPEIMVKLDKVLLQTKNFSAIPDHHDKTCSFKLRIESLSLENRRLRALLVDKIKELECLSLQLYDAVSQLSNCSTTEANLLMKMAKLNVELEDLKIETFVRNHMDRCIINELIHEVKCQVEDLQMENVVTAEICGIILRGSVVDAYSSLNSVMYDEENKLLATDILQKEKALELEVEKTEQLKQEVASLSALINDEKSALSLEVERSEKLNQEIVSLSGLMGEKNNIISEQKKQLDIFSKELNFLKGQAIEREKIISKQKEQLDIFSEELNLLKGQVSEREKLISERKTDSNLLKARLDEALNHIQQSDAKICELNQRLTVVTTDLEEAEKQKETLCAIIQQKQSEILLVTAQVDEQTEQLESIVIFAQELSKSVIQFESIVIGNIERRSSRLETLCYQYDAIIKHVDILKRRELWYKKKLENKTSDLEKAEVEVDLLGDEVDALLNILEKIYIALDHYFPVLQHYPGVMEILKLVRRELKGSD